ncbi:hypothetical protein EIP91_008595 [Steccherinum ochraceum]|uniref:BTB domain-containing protein n=1 Tax=Steccherinum ochraceum TaxID=92696 RepID=A0A4R0RTX1_9APHY|nr:hypothetical protein EIP91_008595 [Steccherinum ochraceum]
MSASKPRPVPKFPLGWKRSPDVWYHDGNIVLVAGSVGFRVYRGVLAQHSTVFADMFKVAQGPTTAPEELYDGCPAVMLSETAEEIRPLLRAMFDFGSPVNALLHIRVLINFLRLSQKYDIPTLRKSTFAAIEEGYFPSSLQDFTLAYATRHTAFQPADYFMLANACIESGVKDVLPAVLMVCAHFEIDVLLCGAPSTPNRTSYAVGATHNTIIELDPTCKLTVLRARQKLCLLAQTHPFYARRHCIKTRYPSHVDVRAHIDPSACGRSPAFSAWLDGRASDGSFRSGGEVDEAGAWMELSNTESKEEEEEGQRRGGYEQVNTHFHLRRSKADSSVALGACPSFRVRQQSDIAAAQAAAGEPTTSYSPGLCIRVTGTTYSLSFGHMSHHERSPANQGLPFGVTSDPSMVDGQTYDYVVVGGGTAGLTVASRLSEDASKRVLVIEAGGDNRTNPDIYDVLQFTVALDGPMDWAWIADHDKIVHGGKTLGGSSSVNGASWTRGTKAQYDTWSTLLDPSEAHLGWDWDGMFKYMKKAENFTSPSVDQRALGANWIASFHGTSGPVNAEFFNPLHDGPQAPAFAATAMNVTGIAHSKDINSGSPNAVSFTPSSIHSRVLNAANRSSSAVSYLQPVERTRTNWVTLVGHMATQIMFSNQVSSLHTAIGVEFGAADGSGPRFTVNVRKEIILAAGAIQSPVLLQLSGIGDPVLLNKFGIPTLVDLKTTQSIVAAHGNGFPDGVGGLTQALAFPNLRQLYGSRADEVIQKINSSLDSCAVSQVDSALSAETLEILFKAQVKGMIEDHDPVMEFYWSGGSPDDLSIVLWPLLPLSRGNVTISSADPFARPRVNVNYFNLDHDLDVHVEGCRLARKLLQSPPLSTLSAGETIPGFIKVPDDADGGSKADWTNWIFNDPQFNFTSNAHPIGTAAMMRRELGGVVDGRLKVYGTANVRVVDASVMPLQISAHLSSTVYGIAEKAADMIKNGT